jgi:predicted dehydrogenase
MTEPSMRVALIGCGFIADHYVSSLRGYPSLELTGVADRNQDRAARLSAFHGLRAYRSRDELLADPKVDTVLNLTNPRAHFEVSRACLEAGKHVYSEKPLAMDLGEAKALVELAAARGLQISGAPCNLLGECAQTMWKALREDHVGRVRVAYAEMDDGMVHRMPYQKWFSQSGTAWPYQDEFEVGCTMEHAGYSLTWLAAFFGPARSVTAFSSLQIPDKLPNVDGSALGPDLTVAAIQFASGVVGRLTCSVIAPIDHSLRITGDKGVLYTPDVWHYDARVYSRKWLTVRRRTLLSPWRTKVRRLSEPGRALGHDDRARGVAEMAAAIREKRPSRLSARFCLHVTELTLAIQQAGRDANTYRMTTDFEPVLPMPWAL